MAWWEAAAGVEAETVGAESMEGESSEGQAYTVETVGTLAGSEVVTVAVAAVEETGAMGETPEVRSTLD